MKLSRRLRPESASAAGDLDRPVYGTFNPFTDVSSSSVFAPAILWAYENGVTSGTTATTFAPGTTATRAQVVTFLYRTNNLEK